MTTCDFIKSNNHCKKLYRQSKHLHQEKKRRMRLIPSQLFKRTSILARKTIPGQSITHYPRDLVLSSLLLLSVRGYSGRRITTSPPPKTMATEIPDRYKLIFFVPPSDLEKCKEAIFAVGAGTFPGGKYSKCCFQTTGTGQFLPSESANPAIGATGTLETLEEVKVEVLCVGREVMMRAVKELVRAHPYEEVAYEVYRLEKV